MLNFIRGVLPWLPYTKKRYYLYDMNLGRRDNREKRVKKAPPPRLDDSTTRGTKRADESTTNKPSEVGSPKVVEETPRTDRDSNTEKLSLEVSPSGVPNRFGAGRVVGME